MVGADDVTWVDVRLDPAKPLVGLVGPESHGGVRGIGIGGAAEYLDCDCVFVDPGLEAQVLARSLRSKLPRVQPPYGH